MQGKARLFHLAISFIFQYFPGSTPVLPREDSSPFRKGHQYFKASTALKVLALNERAVKEK